MVRYDVVICGAGPSGSTAAKYIAEKGLKVVLLEKRSFPRDKPCGGALRPTIMEEFSYLRNSMKNIPSSRCYRAKMYPPSLKNTVDYKPGKVVLYQVQRKHFDSMLAELARSAGAELRENSEVKSVTVKGETSIVQLKNGKEVKGKLIIGAGGMHDPIARYLRKKEGLPHKWPESDIGLAVVEEFEVSEDFIINNYGKERTSHFHLKPNNFYGYAWTFPKIKTLNIGFGAYWKDMKRANIKEVFSKYLALLKQGGFVPENIKVRRPKGGLIPLRGGIRKTYSDHILILGDAAGFVSPIGGDGISYGMCSGRLASEVAEYAVEYDSFGKDGLKDYQEKWYKEWGKDLEVLCYFADKVSIRVEQIMKYGSKDEKFKEMAAGLYNGECKPSKMKRKIIRRIARDFFLYDMLKIGT